MTEKKYDYNEAYCLMSYKCETCGKNHLIDPEALIESSPTKTEDGEF